MLYQTKPQCVKSRKTLDGWALELDNASWAELMTGLSIAIDYADQERAARLRSLRTALSSVEVSR